MTSPKLRLVDEPMTPQHLMFCLSRLGWRTSQAALELGEGEPRVWAYQEGRKIIPKLVERYLELRLKLKELSDA